MRVSLALPPGIVRNGTEYASKGRWFDCNLVRFFESVIRPFGGWRIKSTSSVTGAARASLAWKDNGNAAWLGIGTESNLYAMARTGVLSDITPSGFTAGRAKATTGGGYGAGLYGAGTYGTPRPDTTLILDATMGSLDTRGENLIFCNADDGAIYEWVPGDPAAVVITNAPTSNRAAFCTPERFVVALGADGDPRLIQWCDQENDTDWTPSDTNQAGNFPLQTGGRLMLGKGAKDFSLVLTDLDAWTMRYVGLPGVYAFTKAGDGCGAISQGCCASLGNMCVWMGRNGFFTCNGGFKDDLPCDVQDFVFSDFNRQQQSLVTCSVNSDFGEVKWCYPSSSATEVNRYVVWNFRNNTWYIGRIRRLSGVDRGVFQYPLEVDENGDVYEHEVGFDYDDDVPFVESGPFEIDTGGNVATVTRLIPDENTVGAVQVVFKTKFDPQGPETTLMPIDAAIANDVRFTARQVKVRYRGNGGDFRIGDMRLDVTLGGLR